MNVYTSKTKYCMQEYQCSGMDAPASRVPDIMSWLVRCLATYSCQLFLLRLVPKLELFGLYLLHKILEIIYSCRFPLRATLAYIYLTSHVSELKYAFFYIAIVRAGLFSGYSLPTQCHGLFRTTFSSTFSAFRWSFLFCIST